MSYTIQVVRVGNAVYANDPSWTVWTSNPAGPQYIADGGTPDVFTEIAMDITGTYNPSFAGIVVETSPIGHGSLDSPASNGISPSLSNETTWGALPESN